MVAAAITQDLLFVSTPATELIGISGRAVGLLNREAEVHVHGELGPYTIVTFEGRNGYVLTAHLTDRASLENARQLDTPNGNEVPEQRRSVGIWLRVLVPLAAVASAATVLLALA